jgi:6-phosphogluconate dehydrogenase
MNKIAIIGLGTMGQNFAKNFASKNIKTAVYNRSFAKTKELGEYLNIQGFEHLPDLVKSLELPRKIFLLVKAGDPTDEIISQLQPLLDSGDILVDCGNSNWKDTAKRQASLRDIHFIGCGISGGSEGALLGPSLMPSGNKVDLILPILEKVSAKDFAGGNCVTNIGLGASGHFVKMVHNGIEYAMMQGLAEVYDILKQTQLTRLQIQSVFDYINTGENQSFLGDITSIILKTMDSEGFLLDKIDSKAGAKGTGRWTVEAGLELGVPVPSIYAAVNARVMTELNAQMDSFIEKTNNKPKQVDINLIQDYLWQLVNGIYFVAYTQGLELIHQANLEYNWEIDIQEIIRIWQGGCIIRSQMLKTLTKLSKQNVYPKEQFDFALEAIITVKNLGFVAPMPVINATADYILSIKSTKLPQNLTQAQRDFFGAHTYQKMGQTFTGGWNL